MGRMILVAMLALASTQASRPAHVGQWTAAFGGATWVRLQLTESKGAIGGRISLGDLEVNAQGEVRRASEAPPEFTPLFDVVLRDAVLSFARKDGDDMDRFELRVLQDVNTAELSFIVSDELRRELAAEGLVVPKPVRLTRVVSR